VLRPRTIDGRYLFHSVFSEAVAEQVRRLEVGSNYPAVNERDVTLLEIACPSMIEQHRIANILDTMDEAIRATERLIEKLKAIKAGLLHDLLTRGIDENGRLREDSAYSEQHAVGELGVWTGGGTPSKQHTAFWQGGDIPWVTPKDMVSSWIDDAQQHITMEGVRAASLSVHQPGDVAVVFRSGILRHTFPVSAGRVPFVVNQDLKVLHPGDYVDSRYAFHTLCALGRRVIQTAVKAGTTVESVDLRTFLAFDLYLPDIHEQQRIVCLLDEADECIFASETKLEKLFFLKQGLMHDLLTGKVRVPIDEEDDDE
jgi:type I restriction enzyme S subunit